MDCGLPKSMRKSSSIPKVFPNKGINKDLYKPLKQSVYTDIVPLSMQLKLDHLYQVILRLFLLLPSCVE